MKLMSVASLFALGAGLLVSGTAESARVWEVQSEPGANTGGGFRAASSFSGQLTRAFSVGMWVKDVKATWYLRLVDLYGVFSVGCDNLSNVLFFQTTQWDQAGGTNRTVRASCPKQVFRRSGDSSTPNLSDGRWHFVLAAFNYDDNDASQCFQRLYVDGQQVAETTSVCGCLASGARNLCFGGDCSGGTDESYWLNWAITSGRYADITLWNRALSDEEVSELMTRRPSGDEGGLVGYWSLDTIALTSDNLAVNGLPCVLSRTSGVKSECSVEDSAFPLENCRYVVSPQWAAEHGYVPSPNATCRTWDDAAVDIQFAVDKARSGEEVRVMPGVYALTSPVVVSGKRDFRVVSFDREAGGVRNRAKTVLDGQGVTRCLEVLPYRAVQTQLDTPVDSNCEVAGFTLANGRAFEKGGGALLVGGASSEEKASLRNRISDCVFTNCLAVAESDVGSAYGGGVFIGTWRPNILDGGCVSNCVFVGNSAQSGPAGGMGIGGGVFMGTWLSSEMHEHKWGAAYDCEFVGNVARGVDQSIGGAIGGAPSGYSSFVVRRSRFWDNATEDAAGRIGTMAGHVQLCRNSLLEGCSFSGSGRAMYGAFVEMCQDSALLNTVFSNCVAAGAYGVVHARPLANGMKVDGCVVTQNDFSLAFLFIERTSVGIRQCLFANNGKSALHLFENSEARCENCTFVMEKDVRPVTFAGNSAATNVSVNCIYDTDMAMVGCDAVGRCNLLSNCLVRTALSSPCPQDSAVTVAAPGFVDAASGDYRPAQASPAVDAGMLLDWHAGAADISGLPRVMGGAVDIGAYEKLFSSSVGIDLGDCFWVETDAGRTVTVFLAEPPTEDVDVLLESDLDPADGTLAFRTVEGSVEATDDPGSYLLHFRRGVAAMVLQVEDLDGSAVTASHGVELTAHVITTAGSSGIDWSRYYESTSALISIANAAPTLVRPTEGEAGCVVTAVQGDEIGVRYAVSDVEGDLSAGVVVEISLDGQLVLQDTVDGREEKSASVRLNSAGAHALEIRATDRDGGSTVRTLRFEVNSYTPPREDISSRINEDGTLTLAEYTGEPITHLEIPESIGGRTVTVIGSRFAYGTATPIYPGPAGCVVAPMSIVTVPATVKCIEERAFGCCDGRKYGEEKRITREEYAVNGIRFLGDVPFFGVDYGTEWQREFEVDGESIWDYTVGAPFSLLAKIFVKREYAANWAAFLAKFGMEIAGYIGEESDCNGVICHAVEGDAAWTYVITNGEAVLSRWAARMGTEMSVPEQDDGGAIYVKGAHGWSRIYYPCLTSVSGKRIEGFVHAPTVLDLSDRHGEWNARYPVVGIGDGAFSRLGVQVVRLGFYVTTIGDAAFAGCKDLFGVEATYGIKEIGDYAFSGCTSLGGMTAPLERLGKGAFANCASLFSVRLQDKLQEIPALAFAGCETLTEVEMPNVRKIGPSAFAGCTSLRALRPESQGAGYPENLTDVGEDAFAQCLKLESVEIPAGVTNIGARAFAQCGALKDVAIIGTNLSIGDFAFAECSSLGEVSFNVDATDCTIGEAAFSDCAALKMVRMPKGVRRIDDCAFADCMALADVYFDGAAPETNHDLGVFDGANKYLVSFVRSADGWGALPGEWEDRPVRLWSNYPNAVAHRVVVFDLRGIGERQGGGELIQRVMNESQIVEPVALTAVHTTLAGWSPDYAEIHSALKFSARYVDDDGLEIADYYVRADGNDANDGLSRDTALRTIGKAIEKAKDGSLILVGDGEYPAVICRGNRHLLVRSENGSSRTFVNGAGAGRCVLSAVGSEKWDVQGGARGLQMSGFTFLNGRISEAWDGATGLGSGVYGGTYVDCVISNCMVSCSDDECGGAAAAASLFNCVIANNTVEARKVIAGGAIECELAGCMIAGNSSPQVAYCTTNRCAISDGPYEQPILTVSPLSASVCENAKSGIRVRVSRSGSPEAAMVVALTAPEAQLSIPSQVEIPVGSASTIFTVIPVDNQVVDGSRRVGITASALGCENAFCDIDIVDDEVPSLSLALSADSLKEGGAKIVVTVTRDLVTGEPLTVYLTGTTASRCTCPSSVTIPAGAASVTFEIEAANDDVARVAAEMTLRASAAGYESASKTFTVEDDDIPGVTLTLTPDAAQEGGSVRATVARADEDDLSKAITVKLSASDPQEIASMPSTVTIPGGKVSVDFNVYLADDGLDNGDREIVLQGAIFIESCGCSGQPSGGDAIEAVLTIIDNNGPALSLSVSPKTVCEGLDEAGFLTISHNSVLDEDLTVRISYDLESEIEVAKEVIIKAGEKSVTVPVKTLNDGVEDGSRLVTIAVEDAAGVFAPDTKWLMVTDQNLPDFSAEIDGSVSSVEAGGAFDCRLTIHNSGFTDCGRAIPYAVYLVPESERDVTKGALVSSGSIDGGLAQNALEVRTVNDITAPSSVGYYRLALVVDPNAAIAELDEANNTTWSNGFHVGPAYSARASVDGELFERGAQVAISGVATRIGSGEQAANVDVDVYVVCDGIRTTLRTKTGAAGQFSVTYQPTSGVCGHCIVGACYPGEGLEDEQDAFDILGLKATSTSALVWDIALGDENTKTLSVRNPTGIDLTGFAIGNNNLPKGCALTLSAPAKLDAGDSQTFRITAKGTDLTDGVDYEPFEIVLTTAEGATLTHKAYFHCQSQKAYLRARPTSIDTTMTVGKVRTVEVEIYNDGKGDTGAVSVSPNFKSPDWLRIIGANITNLGSNESAIVTFVLSPEDRHGLRKNYLYPGTVDFICENGPVLTLPVRFMPVSEECGAICVDAIDDHTRYSPGNPHVSNAVVKVLRPGDQKIIATGLTDEQGIWTIPDIPAGTYQIVVTADNHDDYAEPIEVEPGRTRNVSAFLQYQSVRVSWDMKKSEITDEYDVELTLVYETNVPQPTVLTHVDTGLSNKKELPVLEEGQQHMFTITLENVGLIAAKRVTLTMPTIEGYTFTLADNDMVVPAKSTVEIPVLFARPAKRKMLMANALKATVVKEEIVPCKPRMNTTTYWDCYVERSYSRPTEFVHNTGLCKKVTYIVDPQPPTEYVPTRGGGSSGGGSAGGGSGGGGIGGGTGTTWKKTNCDPCVDGFVNDVKNEILTSAMLKGSKVIRDQGYDMIPFVSCAKSIGSIVYTFSGKFRSWLDKAMNNDMVRGALEDVFADYSIKGRKPKEVVKDYISGILDTASCVADVAAAVFSAPSGGLSLYASAGIKKALSALKKGVDFVCDLWSDISDVDDMYDQIVGIGESNVGKYKILCETSKQEKLRGILDDVIVANGILQAAGRVMETWTSEDVWDKDWGTIAKVLPEVLYAAHDSKDGVPSAQRLKDRLGGMLSDREVDEIVERWNRMYEDVDNGNYDELAHVIRDVFRVHKGIEYIRKKRGHDDFAKFLLEIEAEVEDLANGDDAVCASVTLKINQTVAMTRTAFDGTLTIENGHPSVPITNVKFEPSVFDEDGNECKFEEYFEILVNDEVVETVDGSRLIMGEDVPATGTRSIVVRFIPTHEAAPTEPKVYRFGGTLTYTDPYSGETMEVPLRKVSMTVEPSPYLKLDYFVQRDVFSDDPDTDEIERSVPAEIAVLIRNKGAAEANNVTISSAQPMIAENEKSLAVAFSLHDADFVGSAIDGSEKYLGLLSTVDLGTIKAGESRVAQWWLTSTLQGHFVDMDATCTPKNKWISPRTELVDTKHIDVHKLVRSVSVDGDDLPDFLVCDEKDLYGLPDQVITSKGVPLSVRRDGKVTVSGTLAGASSDLLVAVTGSEGWNYMYLPIVGVSGYEVAGVSCDGAELPARNVWTTDRTFRDAGKPVVEDRLHLLVYFSEAATKDIHVHLNGTAANGPKVESFEGVTAGAMEHEVRDAVTVVFDRAIDPTTFGVADLQLIRQGAYVSDLSGVTIRATDGSNRSFELSGLAAYCSEKGRYELVVQCAGIRSADGQSGSVGKSVSWMLGASGAADSFVVTREVGVAGNVFTFTFNNPSIKLTSGHLVLTKNGAAVGLPPTVKIVDKGLGVYEVTGLDTILAEEGTYSISCDLCEGVAASWSDDLTPPVAAKNLRISPDGGIDENDGITYTRELTVTGDLSEDGLAVEVFVSYAGAEPVKLADAIVKGRTFSACVVLPADGNATLVVRSTDAAGNSSDATKDVYVDVIPFTAEFTGAPAEDIVADRIDLVFSDEIFEGDLELGHFLLTRDGVVVSLSDALFAGTDKSHFFLERLESVCGEDGTYTLTLNAPAVRKRSSGLTLSVQASVTWTYKCPDREPPTAGEVSIDGAAVVASYDLAFGRIEIPFSEPVNVPDLIADGLITVAVRTDFAYLPSWNSANNVLTLTVLDEKLPRGAGRVVLDPALIKDMAGNELDCGQSEYLAGTDRYGEGLQLAKVDGYAMPTWHDGQLTVGYKTSAGAGVAKTGDQILVSGIAGSGCQGVSVCWADWDVDGTEELVVGESNGRVSLRKGTTTTEIRSGSEATYGSTRAVLCSFDADGDGTSESVVCGGADGKFRRLWKQEDGTVGCEWLADSQGLPIVVVEGRSAPAFADVNHDGRIDLLTGDTKGNVWLYYGTDGAWISTPVCLVDNSKGKFSDRSRVAYGDVNSDGVGDLIVGRSDGSVVALVGESRPAATIEYEIVWPITLGESLNLPAQTWEVGGAAEWTPEWSDGASDGEHCAFIRNVGNNANAWMQTTVDGPGEISFMWMCDLASKNTKLQFFVDDVAQGVLSGSSPWTPVRVTVYGEGAHVLKWRLFTGRSGAAATDVGAVDAVTWTPAVPPTLAEALNTNLTWKTSGARQWRGVAKDSRIGARENWAVASGLDDNETAAIETRVYGNGLLVFDWGVSCEEEYDWLEVSVDGEVKTYITGETGWTTEAVDIIGEGWHVVRWEYIKDEMDEPELVGDNSAKLDSVLWYSDDVLPEEPEKTATENTPVPVPFVEIDAKYKSYLDAANGDYEAAALAVGKNGYAIWECYVAGLDPDNEASKFTVKIEMKDGKPVVTWDPPMNGKNDDGTCIKKGVRVYKLSGSTDLKDWLEVGDGKECGYNFFKVTVDLPSGSQGNK